METSTIFGLPEAPTVLFVVALVIVLGYMLLRSYSSNLQAEIAGLRKALDAQSERHRLEMAEVNTKVDSLEGRYDEQRTLKHKAINDLTRSDLLLHIVADLAAKCTCAALEPVTEMLISYRTGAA